MNSETLMTYLKNRIDHVHRLIQQQRPADAREACCDLIAEARILQHQLQIEGQPCQTK